MLFHFQIWLLNRIITKQKNPDQIDQDFLFEYKVKALSFLRKQDLLKHVIPTKAGISLLTIPL
jgi:hypothetical protein